MSSIILIFSPVSITEFTDFSLIFRFCRRCTAFNSSYHHNFLGSLPILSIQHHFGYMLIDINLLCLGEQYCVSYAARPEGIANNCYYHLTNNHAIISTVSEIKFHTYISRMRLSNRPILKLVFVFFRQFSNHLYQTQILICDSQELFQMLLEITQHIARRAQV